ncbi:LSR isoform 5, partial [Pongo abelii]
TQQDGLGVGTRNGSGKGRSVHPSWPWCAPRPLSSCQGHPGDRVQPLPRGDP